MTQEWKAIMALWLFRAGRRGEYEKKFLDEKRVYITWHMLPNDLSKLQSRQELMPLLEKSYPDSKPRSLQNNASQIWSAAHDMTPGGWIVTPSKLKPAALHFAEITAGYQFDPSAVDPFHHYLEVKWFATDVPRSVFDQDLLYSFGAVMTICQIKRNEAEARVRAMAKAGWKKNGIKPTKPESDATSPEEVVDLERLARDQIAKLIVQKFKGHELARLVEAILKAQGYTTYLSPEGPDKGVDILAAPGPLGFGNPRLCVQVKSGDSPVDSPTLNQLIGAMQNVQADQGLLVSWSGFKSSVDKEVAVQFFRVRLWDQDTLISELLSHYEALDEDLRADIPLKRIWTITTTEEEV
jgi:restriction system protein